MLEYIGMESERPVKKVEMFAQLIVPRPIFSTK